MLALMTAGKSIFGRFEFVLLPVFARRCLAGARSVTSCAKFISHSSFVDPAQTIKGAAGMTSAWKIPHMERWKMTCGFLSTQANSAFWQRTRVGGMHRSCISGFFFVYTVICQSSETIRGCFVNSLWKVQMLVLLFQCFCCNYGSLCKLGLCII